MADTAQAAPAAYPLERFLAAHGIGWRNFALSLLDGSGPGVVRVGDRFIVPEIEARAYLLLRTHRARAAEPAEC